MVKKSGAVSHWWMQRLSAVFLLPLCLWFLLSLPHLGGTHAEVSSFFKSFRVVLGGLFTFFLFYHGSLGLQVIIEDYLPEKRRHFFFLLVKGISLWGMLAGAFSLLRICLV